MPDESDNVSGWTVDTLRMYMQEQIMETRADVTAQFAAMNRLLDERQQAAEKSVKTALISAEKAANKLEAVVDRRFENMYEFRQQLADQASTFMPRTEAVILISAVEEKLSTHIKVADENLTSIRTRLDLIAGGSGALWRFVTLGVSIVAVAITFYAIMKP